MAHPPRLALIAGCVRYVSATMRSEVHRFQQARCDVPDLRWILVKFDIEDKNPLNLGSGIRNLKLTHQIWVRLGENPT